jgi:hypothetical protein
MIWGITFYFSWFSVISNQPEVDSMMDTMLFNTVSGTVYTVPVFLFCSGFLQTFSFLQKDKEESMFTPAKLMGYIFKKFTRYIPVNAVCLLTVVYIMPYIGSGPIWNNFATLTAPCGSKWWTNILWVNNIYPREFDDKCLPWTWFVPCYVQLSLLLPFILAIYRLPENKVISGVIYAIIGALALYGSFEFAYAQNLGGTMVGNEAFYAKVFMNPLMHFSSFF